MLCTVWETLKVSGRATLVAAVLTSTVGMAWPVIGRAQGVLDPVFVKPYDPPLDVFDLPTFDPFRSGGKLDLPAARRALEKMSDANLPSAQRLFDITAWRAFVALNWPADADGTPLTNVAAGYTDKGHPKAWEFWKQSSDIFLSDGSPPKPWGVGGGTMKLDHWKAGWRQHTILDQGTQAFSGPLIDQNGNWLHYNALVNKVEYDYIVENKLYFQEGQAEFLATHVFEFPINTDTTPGCIELKLAWKTLTKADDESRYLVREIPIVRYGGQSPPAPGEATEGQKTGKAIQGKELPPVKVGLVGMHITMRTASSPQWIWATFEQIDNTHVDPGTVPHGETVKASLSDSDNPEALVGANILPAKNAKPDPKTGEFTDWDEEIKMAPVEVLRLVPPPNATANVNREMQELLGRMGSVLRYYELNGTQWPKHPLEPAVPGGQGSAPESVVRKMPGHMVPVYLTNATMETYFQKGFQDAGPLEQDDRVSFSIDTTKVFGTESCVGCHYSAGACIGFRKGPDGQFLRDGKGRKIPIWGENAHGGLNGNSQFSWMFQIESQSNEPPAPAAAK